MPETSLDTSSNLAVRMARGELPNDAVQLYDDRPHWRRLR
jgi:hypothetical protein